MNELIEVSLAGLTFSCALRYPEAARGFPKPDPAARRVGGEPLRLTEADWEYFLAHGTEPGPAAEFSLLTAACSDALLEHERLVLHAVALRWGDSAWLIAAPSGVGKSTQARWLQQLRPKEFGVISGDRPILEFCHSERSEESASLVPSLPLEGKVSPVRTLVTDEVAERQAADSTNSSPEGPPHPSSGFRETPESTFVPSLPLEGKVSPVRTLVTDEVAERQAADSTSSSPEGPPHPSSGFRETPESTFPSRGRQYVGSILVHPSPWNGKENWYGAETAPLAGIILLRRGEENELLPLRPREAAIRLYGQVIQRCAEPEKMQKAAELTTRILNSVPVWQLTTHQVPDSTRLLLEKVFR